MVSHGMNLEAHLHTMGHLPVVNNENLVEILTENRSKHSDDDKALSNCVNRLPNSVFWISPTPVRYVIEDGQVKWTTRGLWEVKFHEEAGGPSIRFCLEEPSLVALSQLKKVNLPLQGWTLFPTHVRRSVFSFSKEKTTTETAAVADDEDGIESTYSIDDCP